MNGVIFVFSSTETQLQRLSDPDVDPDEDPDEELVFQLLPVYS